MRIFLISLPESQQRRLSALDRIVRMEIPFEIVDGVEARKYRPEMLPICPKEIGSEMQAGEVGCYAAHLRALQRIVEYRLPWAFVLEDDFCLEADPEFGFVEIARHLPREFHYVHLQRNRDVNPRFAVTSDEGPFQRVCETPYDTAGYIMTRTLAEYVLQHHALCKIPIDVLYAQLSHRGLFYQCKKPLVGVQTGLTSDIWPGRQN